MIWCRGWDLNPRLATGGLVLVVHLGFPARFASFSSNITKNAVRHKKLPKRKKTTKTHAQRPVLKAPPPAPKKKSQPATRFKPQTRKATQNNKKKIAAKHTQQLLR